MPKYRVLEKSFIGNALVEEGAIVDYDGKPGPNLELVKGQKRGASDPDPEPDAPAGSAPEGTDPALV